MTMRKPFQGAVLLDNTTIFGARRALEWDPLLLRTLPPGVDLRSLMDILEAIVLMNDMIVDSSSRKHDAWPELNRLSAVSRSSFHRDTDRNRSACRHSSAPISRCADKGHRVNS
jgi:hypothetical protein